VLRSVKSEDFYGGMIYIGGKIFCGPFAAAKPQDDYF